MPIDMTNTDEGSMFAPIPSWERNRKRGLFGAPSAPRVTTAPVDERLDAVDAPLTNPLDAPLTNPDAEVFASAPIYAARPVARRGGGAAMAVTAGLVALIGLGAAAFYASRPHDSGLAQLTPGSTSISTTTTVAPSTMALNDAAKPAAPTTHVSSAVNPAPARAATKTTTTTTTTTTRLARARPPASRSVGDAGVNASATQPSGPMPYNGKAVDPAPTAAPAPMPVSPAEAAPAPVQSAPAPEASAPAATPAAPQ